MPRIHQVLLAASLLALSGTAFAGHDIVRLKGMSQSQFDDLSADLGSIAAFRPLAPAEPDGITGFDIGFDLGATRVGDGQAWKYATGGHHVDHVFMARVRARKGLPLGIDVGAFYGTSPDSNIRAYGAEVRYALLKGSIATPVVGLRATYSRLRGVDHLNLDTGSLGLSISKGFGPLTPFGGVGYVWTSSNPDASTQLGSEHFGKGQVFAGVKASLGPTSLVLEADRIGQDQTYDVKFGFGF